MAAKKVLIPEVGQVTLYKRRGVRGVRLSITHSGDIRISLPTWAPYRLGVEFAKTKAAWIQAKAKPKPVLRHNDHVGKALRLIFESDASKQTVTSRIVGTDIRIKIPSSLSPEDEAVQAVAEKAAIRALKKEAEQLLPPRVAWLAQQHGFTYRSLKIKRLTSRWGSCNHRSDLVFNCYLMQLPWQLIDYVILHELTHTRIMSHGRPFWDEMAKYADDVKQLRRDIKQYQPTLVTRPLEPSEGPTATKTPIAVQTV